MKTTPLNEITQLEDGELVMRVEGEITKCYEIKSGEKDSKPWSVQHFFIKDDSGELKVSAWNHDDIQPLTHKKVSITAHKSDKGFSGVYAEDNEWKQKITRQLRLTATAKIERLDGQQSADSSHKDASSARPNTQRVSTPPREHQNDSTGFDDMLQQVNNAQYKVFDAAKRRWEQMIVDRLIPENTEFVGDAHFQADCSSAFIKLDRAGEVEKLSTAPIWREANTSRFVKSPMAQPPLEDDEIPF